MYIPYVSRFQSTQHSLKVIRTSLVHTTLQKLKLSKIINDLRRREVILEVEIFKSLCLLHYDLKRKKQTNSSSKPKSTDIFVQVYHRMNRSHS